MSEDKSTRQLLQEEFAIEITDKAPTHQDWLLLMRFGMGTLLQNHLLLIELIFREAERLKKQRGESYSLADGAIFICNELGLRFECSEETA